MIIPVPARDEHWAEGERLKKALSALMILLVLIVMAILYFGQEKRVQTGQPDVVVSTFALYDIARHLLGHDADVQMLIPFGRDVHSFEPTPKDMIRVEKSKLFLYSGAGLEPWTKQFQAFSNAVDMSRYVTLQKRDKHLHDAAEEDGHHHEGAYDPHYWLDIDNMIALTRAMASFFPQKLGLDSTVVQQRAQAYIDRLKILDTLYRKRLSGCALDTIVVGHNAFGYLGERYGFHVEALSGLSPDHMPDARTMAALTDLVKKKKIRTVFYESFVSDRMVAAIAKEAGVRVDVLQPLANITADEIGADYFHLMNLNLLKLHDALECR